MYIVYSIDLIHQLFNELKNESLLITVIGGYIDQITHVNSYVITQSLNFIIPA